MKAAGILAVLGAALLSVGAFAQNNQMANLSADHIIAPEGRAAETRHDIILVTDRPVEIRSAVARLTGIVDGETISLPGHVLIQPNCAGDVRFPITVQPIPPNQPNQSCAISVSLTGISGPGRYTAKVSLFGATGGRQDLTLEFAHRRPLGWPIGLVLAGLVTGLIVTSWRGGGRDRTRTGIEIKDAIEALELLDAGQPDQPGRMRPVIARARAMEAALIGGGAVEAAEVAELGARPSQYRFLLDIETTGATLPADKRAELAVAIAGAISKMMPSASGKLATVPDADFNTVKEKLGELQESTEVALGDAAGAPTPDLPLPLTARMSSRAARRAFALWEWGVALILMLVFAAVAIGTLYFGKPYWGNYGDLLAAFMIGFGAYAGAVASVDSFVQRARTAS